MADVFTREKRSEVMSKIRSKNTKVEIRVRRELWARGMRFRIHCKSVPGRPDICNKKRKIAIFIDGCFWHACPECYIEPKSNRKYWKMKIMRNKDRRRKVIQELEKEDYHVLQFWECQIKKSFVDVISEIDRIWG